MISISPGEVLATLLFASAAWACPTQNRPSATIKQGIVIGTATSIPSSTVTVNKFLGIPFASPPERFALPVPPKQWKKPLDAFKNKPACIQEFGGPEGIRELLQLFVNTPPPEAGESEDCLYVNVWAPASPPPRGGRTVMFWMYGGNLQLGSNSSPYYDGTMLAAHHDVIIVAPNYRTNGEPPPTLRKCIDF
jgi:carboxylesterase type B